uniref:Uncharacterized protein n=1 Tax=Caenorhabditis japonica TaxID=281687 RepID=A0A8R1EAA2_CAEJA
MIEGRINKGFEPRKQIKLLTSCLSAAHQLPIAYPSQFSRIPWKFVDNGQSEVSMSVNLSTRCLWAAHPVSFSCPTAAL